jgi:hypothetical protein
LDLLDRISSTELLSDAIQSQFKVYVEKHELDHDSLLSDYCIEILDKYGMSCSIFYFPQFGAKKISISL